MDVFKKARFFFSLYVFVGECISISVEIKQPLDTDPDVTANIKAKIKKKNCPQSLFPLV